MAMAISSHPQINDGTLRVGDRTFLVNVPATVSINRLDYGGALLGATAPGLASRHVFSLGHLVEGFKWLCLFRFNIWWMIPRWGESASDIPLETQMLLLDATIAEEECSRSFYILVLPVLDGDFRASLQGSSDNEIQFCLESGDPDVQISKAIGAIFINSGDNPYELIENSIRILSRSKGTFNHLKTKKIPDSVGCFGWCTWDAFYKNINPESIEEGLQSLCEGGTPPKFVIIDDGWQDTSNEFQNEGEPHIQGTEFAARLVHFEENNKFKGGKYKDLGEFVRTIKRKYGLRHVYMWHALLGYWGGVDPKSEAMKNYNPKLVYPVQSPGNIGNIRDIAMDSLEKYGIGIVDPDKMFEFYNDLHTYLSKAGVNGVKVDVQNVVETIGHGFGGRVKMTRNCQYALAESIAKNFGENNLISCMSHNSDSLYSSSKSAVARASEDFMPREERSQTRHIATIAFNSILMGEILIPDWDMFHSKHVAAEFHAAARALSGSSVYVSDKPGRHDFSILKKLVLPDGSILRALYPARPTRGCLFVDPLMDGKSLLKIWNLNKLSGVVGVFNCQGNGCWPMKEQQIHGVDTIVTIKGHVSPLDIEYFDELAGNDWHGESALYAFSTGSLTTAHRNLNLEISLSTLECEIYTISPIKVFNQELRFAPLGLINMYNSGGALEEMSYETTTSGCIIKIKCRGPGLFGAYSSVAPISCAVDMKEMKFIYDAEQSLLAFDLPYGSEHEGNFRDIDILFGN